MEIILIMLCSILFGCFSFGFFCLGYYVRDKKPSEEGMTVTRNNRDFVEEMAKWRSFDGRQ